MKGDIDIHTTEQRFNSIISLLKNGGVSKKSKCKQPISLKNIELILKFSKIRALEGIKLHTQKNDIVNSMIAARLLEKDFDKINPDDIKTLIYSSFANLNLRNISFG